MQDSDHAKEQARCTLCSHRSLTLYVPIVSKINFLLMITIDCQEQSLRELIK